MWYNVGKSRRQSDFVGAGLDLVGVLPGVGEVADAAKTGRAVNAIVDGARVAKTMNGIVDGVQATDKALDTVKVMDKASDTMKVADDVADTAKTVDDFYDAGKQIDLPNVKYPGDDPTISPGEGFEWRGKGPMSEGKGAWYKSETDESMHWDLNHGEPIGPHWDYTDSEGNVFRVYKDGRVELSKKGGKRK